MLSSRSRCVSWVADRRNCSVQIMLKTALWSMPALSLKGVSCHSLAYLPCPGTATTSCDRQSYREIPVSLSCPARNGKNQEGCMGFSCKSTRFVLAARDVPRMLPLLSQISKYLVLWMNSWAQPAAHYFSLVLVCLQNSILREAGMPTPGTHLWLNSVKEREVPNTCSDL